MKKAILSIIALMAFGIASAQTEPKTPPPPPAPKELKANTDADTQNQIPQTTEQRRNLDGADSRKTELKTRGHIKSTYPNIGKDKDTVDRNRKVEKTKTEKTKTKKSS